MAEQTTATNQRHPIYRVATGNTLKGATIQILGTPDDKRLEALRPNDKVWVREFIQFPRPGTALREATIGWRNLVRAFRSKEEDELARDFTDEEAAERERRARLRVAEHQVGYHRDVVLAKMESIANSLERASQDVRRAAEQSEHYGLASAVSRVQHDVAWLFPNLGADTLTTSLVEFLRMEVEVKRLGGASEEAES